MNVPRTNASGRRALRVAAYCVLGGLPLSISAVATGGFLWWWLAGAVLATAFLPVALYGPRSRAGQFAVIASVLWVVSVIFTWTEAVFFLPESPLGQNPLGSLASGLAIYALVAACLALLGTGLAIGRPSGTPVPRRGLPGTVLVVLISGLAYLVYYFVTGAITYEYFTSDWYPEATERVLELGGWFWAMQIGRGTAMALAMVPFVYTLRMSRRATALATGLLLWVAGGLAPLLTPNELLSGAQRFVHTVEILTQNAPLGVTVALLLRPGSARGVSPAAQRSADRDALIGEAGR